MKTYYLKHSPILSISILRKIVYEIQGIFVQYGWADTLYASERVSLTFEKVVSAIERRNCEWECQTFQLGFQLSFLKKPIHLDVTSSKVPIINTEEKYDTLLWTLVNCRSISNSTLETLKKVFETDFSSLYEKTRS